MTAATCSTAHVAGIEAPRAIVVPRAEQNAQTLGVRTRPPVPRKVQARPDPNGDRDRRARPRPGLPAAWKAALALLVASAGPNGDRDRREHPRAGLPVARKVTLGPLTGSDALGLRAPPAAPEHSLAREPSPMLGKPRPGALPRRKLRRVERSRASNREQPIAISCSQTW